MFKEMMEQIEEFLENTRKISTSSQSSLKICWWMIMMRCTENSQRQQKILANETPDICASAEPGMKPAEIEVFKSQLEKEYQRAKQGDENKKLCRKAPREQGTPTKSLAEGSFVN